MNLRPAAAFLAAAVCVLHSAGTFAQAPVVDARELDERLKRLERLFESGALFKLVEEMDSLAAEVRELRGQAEALSHRIEQMEERQRQLYLDADQRLQRIESGAPAQAAGSSPQPGALPAAPTTPTQTATPGQTPAGDDSDRPDARRHRRRSVQRAGGIPGRLRSPEVRALRRSRPRVSAVHRGISNRKLRRQRAVLARRDVLHHAPVRAGGAGVRAARLDAPHQSEAHPRAAEDRVLPRRARQPGGSRAGVERVDRTPSAVGRGRPRTKAAHEHPAVADTSGRVGRSRSRMAPRHRKRRLGVHG